MDSSISSALLFDDYQLLFNSIDEGIKIIEKVETGQNGPANFRYVLTNPAFERITGLDSVIGKTMTDVLPGLNDSTLTIFDSVLKTSKPVRFETYEKSIDRWFSAYAFPIEDPKLQRIAVIFNDISEIKKTEANLRESKEHQGFLLKLSDAIRSISDPNQIQFTACSILGEYIGASRVLYGDVIDEKEVVISRDYTNDVPSIASRLNDEDLRQMTIDSCKSGRPVIINDVDGDLRLDSHERIAYSSIQVAAAVCLGLIKNGKWVAVFSVHQNRPRVFSPLEISLVEETAERIWTAVELAKAEEVRRESERRYHDLFNSIDEGFCIMEVLFDGQNRPFDCRFLEVNPAFERQTGLVEAEGRCMREMIPGHEQNWFDFYGKIALTGAPIRFQDSAEKLGRFYDVFAFRVGKPEQHRVAVIFLDISARKHADDALRESENRARALIQELEETDRNKNQFISILSHELRNPLAAISVSLSVLDVSTDKHQTEQIIDIIKRQTGQLCKLVDDLLDLTRISKNKIRLQKKNILLDQIVRHTVEDIRPEFMKKGVFIEESIPALPICLYADPVRIAQCAGNLMRNALKFTPACGIVRVALKQEGNVAVLTVRDNGIGISPNLLSDLFLPFSQADDSLEGVDNNGLGLGLTIVKGIIELHGGFVLAESDGLGKGSMFTIRLPISDRMTETDGNAPSISVNRGFRILIIEDNKDFAEMIRSLINILSHEAFVAHDGTKGIQMARELMPDIIFCDIGLPGKNGYEIARIIREDEKLKNVFLIALTGYASEHDIHMAKNSGFDRHLAKPVNMEDLKRVLGEKNMDD